MRVKISYSVDVDLDVYRARHHADTPFLLLITPPRLPMTSAG